ncbi:21554_t:CDS:2 [Cetraspora pellucida]|uniref:21554_t:CDS:1 n=1 Tax=Cetraspora pellucida TaxID=1433469 RepID=A0A9N8ZZJ1_9GLOM|nr:21554_t:CDS:2 [Cetraspora pellucida]
MNQLETISKKEADKQLKFTEIVQRNYKIARLNCGTDKPKKEYEIYFVTEIKESYKNRKEQIIELVKYFFHQASKKTFEESIDELKETVIEQLKKREFFEESIIFDKNYLVAKEHIWKK